MKTTVLSFLAISAIAALSLAGCASADGQSNIGESTEDLSSQHDAKLFGAYTYDTAGGASMGFQHLVLESDGSYFSERTIYCFAAPCPAQRTYGLWSSTSYANTLRGQLTLLAKGGVSTNYQVSIAGDNSSIKLQVTGSTAPSALYDRSATFCDTTADCNGQPVPVTTQLCMVGLSHQTVCSAQNTCVSQCLPTKPECTTDADCRLFDNYCSSCECDALSSTTPDPTCTGPGVRCLREPCGGHSAVCSSGKCTVH